MEPKAFNNLLHQQASAADIKTEDMQAVIRDYPWYSAPHLLMAKKNAGKSEQDFEEQLNRAAVYAQDRVHLYHWLRGGSAEVRTIETDVEEEFEQLAEKAERELARGHMPKQGGRELLSEESTEDLAEEPDTTQDSKTEVKADNSYPAETEDKLEEISRLTNEIKSDKDSPLGGEADDIGAAAVAAAFSLAHSDTESDKDNAGIEASEKIPEVTEQVPEVTEQISGDAGPIEQVAEHQPLDSTVPPILEHQSEVHSFSDWLQLMGEPNINAQLSEELSPSQEPSIEEDQTKETTSETPHTQPTLKHTAAEEIKPAPVEWDVVDPIIAKQRERAISKKGKTNVSPQDMSMHTPVSETYAKILEQQGMTERALAVYEQLSLIYPDKSAYFAGLIRKLKETEQ